MTIRVVYQNGVFRPLAPVDVAEGTEAEIQFEVDRPKKSRLTPEEVRARLLQLADKPLENTTGERFSGTDHDRILYGKPHQS